MKLCFLTLCFVILYFPNIVKGKEYSRENIHVIATVNGGTEPEQVRQMRIKMEEEERQRTIDEAQQLKSKGSKKKTVKSKKTKGENKSKTKTEL